MVIDNAPPIDQFRAYFFFSPLSSISPTDCGTRLNQCFPCSGGIQSKEFPSNPTRLKP